MICWKISISYAVLAGLGITKVNELRNIGTHRNLLNIRFDLVVGSDKQPKISFTDMIFDDEKYGNGISVDLPN